MVRQKIKKNHFQESNYILYIIIRWQWRSIKEVKFRVETCCIDEITLAFNALTNHNPGLTTSRQHHNENIMIYNSKNTFKNCILWNTILVQSISIKLLFNPFFFVKLDDINWHKTPKFCYNQINVIEVLYLFIF